MAIDRPLFTEINKFLMHSKDHISCAAKSRAKHKINQPNANKTVWFCVDSNWSQRQRKVKSQSNAPQYVLVSAT